MVSDDQIRDLLALEAKATPGQLDLLDSRVETWHFTAPNGNKVGAGCVEWQMLGGQPPGFSSDYGFAVLHGKASRGEIVPKREDLLLVAAARNAIRPLCEQLLTVTAERDALRVQVADLERRLADLTRLVATAEVEDDA